MPTNKRNRVAATKKRRHASPVTSSQNSCTGEANLQEVCGRHASPVTSSQNYHFGEANLQKVCSCMHFFITRCPNQLTCISINTCTNLFLHCLSSIKFLIVVGYTCVLALVYILSPW